MTNEYAIPLPETDEWGTPRTKMPNCPHCGEDELGMISADHAVCCRCSAIVIRHDKAIPITAMIIRCAGCPWMGRLEAAEPDGDGELHCPQCLNIINVRVPTPKELR